MRLCANHSINCQIRRIGYVPGITHVMYCCWRTKKSRGKAMPVAGLYAHDLSGNPSIINRKRQFPRWQLHGHKEKKFNAKLRICFWLTNYNIIPQWNHQNVHARTFKTRKTVVFRFPKYNFSCNNSQKYHLKGKLRQLNREEKTFKSIKFNTNKTCNTFFTQFRPYIV